MNLLVISDNDKTNYHYVYIRYLNRLLSPSSKHNGVQFGDNYLKRFISKETFYSENHKCNY